MNTHQIKMSKLLGGKVNKYSKAQIKGSEFHDMFSLWLFDGLEHFEQTNALLHN